MRAAFFSPLPPKKSGIADYSAALLAELRRLAEIETFVEDNAAQYRPEAFDITLYQVGNNPDHSYLYPIALRHPGVVVLHEFNLHHLIADLTIRRQDWEGYLREAELNGGAEALAHARRVQALETGPDYDLPMTRRLLESSRALIVHSRFMAEQARRAGYQQPIAVIPHGASLTVGSRNARRRKLGVDETTPLVGIFGFLKPYKRIGESLRAFQRLVRLEPRVKMILAGEEHPELQLRSLVAQMGIEAHVRVLGYVPIEDFEELISAVDICLNLRYPTVGESSGTMLRALGMGRAVVVSEVGAFAELPDEICLKVPVDDREVDLLFEYLNLLVSRPEVRRAMGDRARAWVEEHCRWDRVAGQYVEFLEAVAAGREWNNEQGIGNREQGIGTPPAAEPLPQPPAAVEGTQHPWGDYILGFASGSGEQLAYAQKHISRLVRTLEITPPGADGDRILEMGAYLQITPALKTLLGYGDVRGCYLGPAGGVDHREARSSSGEAFACEIDLFDAEKDPFPYPDGHFSTVLCCELIEHLPNDPMHMMSEINRILRPGGTLVLTTPNVCSLRAIDAILQGYHPGFFHQYIRPAADGDTGPRHHREYSPRDVKALFEESGFEMTRLETGPFLAVPTATQEWIVHMLDQYKLSQDLRGDGIYAVGRKARGVRTRYPAALYAGGER